MFTVYSKTGLDKEAKSLAVHYDKCIGGSGKVRKITWNVVIFDNGTVRLSVDFTASSGEVVNSTEAL